MSLVALPVPTPSDEESFFRRNVPPSMLSAMLRVVFDGCIAAYDLDKREFASAYFKDMLPTLRRGKVDPALLGLTKLAPGFSTILRETPARTHYTEILSKHVVITARSRSKHVFNVDLSRYGEMLARSKRQMPLPFENEPRFDPKTGLYALLVYGGRHRQRLPSEARIVFPMANGEFMPDEIDLLREFPDIVSSYQERGAEGPEPRTGGDGEESGEA